MSKKIFEAIWTAVLIVFLASLILIMGISYRYFSFLQRMQLRNETELAAQGVSLSGKAFFEKLRAEEYRITWIDAEGNILYDNEADSEKMENHLEREEVRQALETGYGEADRYSSTLADKQLYAAQRLPDGTVLRLSIVQASVWTLLFGFAQPILAVVLIALILSGVLASRLALKIVRPINEIDPEHPEHYYGKEDYKEVETLLRHIAAQNRQIRRDQEKIERTALIRQEFTANVSHEMKTPLQTISGHAELLENGLVKEEDIRPFARKIRAEALRMTRLVEDIIVLTRLDTFGEERQWEHCDLYQIAENALDSLETVASSRKITLELEGSPVRMKAIPQMLYSIVYNLCDNAIKYNYEGGTVTACVEQNENNTILTVSDTGIGIPEESRERVFERFYRVDKSHSKEVGGTGLGLSIVKHAVKIHDGVIEIRSRPAGGTRFVVILPNEPETAGV